MRQEDRMVVVLINESRRMRESAERVDLVVRALALRKGIRGPATERPEEAAD